jgi:(p)ppGpp synthase/HD superfamily hydrolase
MKIGEFPIVRVSDLKRWDRPLVPLRSRLRMPRVSSVENPISVGPSPIQQMRAFEQRLSRLIERVGVRTRAKDAEGVDEISRVIRCGAQFAAEGHNGVKRKSGEPYFEHSISVAEIVEGWGLGGGEIVAAFCHDTREDALIEGERVTREFLAEHLGERVALLIEGVTELGKEPEFMGEKPAKAAIHRKMVEYGARDLAILPLKLADRLHNMRTLEYVEKEKQEVKAWETMNVYVPIADRLGMWEVKRELEDHSFRYLDHDTFEAVDQARSDIVEASQARIEKIVDDMKRSFAKRGFDVKVLPERRFVYELHERMKNRKKKLEELTPSDVWRINLVVPAGDDCYRILGFVHALYSPVPGEFRTYIHDPMTNGHQFLHDYVEAPKFGQLLVQVRDQSMYNFYRIGILSRIRGTREWYKENPDWLRSAHAYLQQEGVSDEEASERMRAVGFGIIVYTKDDKPIELPAGATVADFACAIHEDVFLHADHAVLQGDNRRVNLYHKLNHGDKVEIITSLEAHPEIALLEHLQTPEAKRCMRKYLANRDPGKIFEDAIRELDRCLKPYHIKTKELVVSLFFDRFIARYGFKGTTAALDYLAEIGKGTRLACEEVKAMRAFFVEEYKKGVEKGSAVIPHYWSVRTENVSGRLDGLTSDLRKLGLNIADILQVESDLPGMSIVVLAVDLIEGEERVPMLTQVQRMQMINIAQQVGDAAPLQLKQVRDYLMQKLEKIDALLKEKKK